jgi:hypothetical protein
VFISCISLLVGEKSAEFVAAFEGHFAQIWFNFGAVTLLKSISSLRRFKWCGVPVISFSRRP